MEQHVVELIVDLAMIVIVNGMRKHKAVAVEELVHVMKNYQNEDVVEEDVDAEMVMVLWSQKKIFLHFKKSWGSLMKEKNQVKRLWHK